MPLYPYIPYCHPMTIVYVNRPWPYNPMYRVVEGKPLGNPCVATKKQADWRWCNKCQSLTYSALGAGVCAMGGGHTFDGSGKYYLNLEASNDCGSQAGWRWCNKCQSITYAGAGAPSVCSAGGAHDNNGSGDYFLCLAGRHGQPDWSWCCKCSLLFYSPFKEWTKCAATGVQHDNTGSGSYQVYHDPIPADPETTVEPPPQPAPVVVDVPPPVQAPPPQSDCCCVIL